MKITTKPELRQNFIAEIAQSLISMENIEVKIQNAITLFGENLNASRVYIFENDASGKYCNNTYEWCNKNIAPHMDELQNFPYEIIPSWQKILNQKGVLSATSIYDLPPDLIEALEPQNIKSIYVLPLKRNNADIGFWGFDYCEHNHTWSENEINLIQILGGLLSATFERTQNIKEINQSKEDFHLLFENMNSAFAVHKLITNSDNGDIDFEYIEANTLYFYWLGKKRSEVINKRIKEILPDIEDERLKKYAEVALTGKPISFTEYFKAADKYFEVNAYCPKPGYFASSFTDITEKKKIEIALAESEENYRLLTNNLSDIVWKYDLNLKCTYISPAVYKVRGYTVEEALELEQLDNFPTESLTLVKNILGKKLEQIKNGDPKGWDSFQLKLKLYKKDKTQIWTQISANLVADENGNPKEIVGSTRDISKQEAAKAALTENENRFRTIFEKSTDPITILKGERFVDCNKSTLAVLKLNSKKEFTDLKPWDISPEFQPDGKKSKTKAKLMIKEAYDKGFKQFDWIHLDGDRNSIWYNVSLTRIELSGEIFLHTIWRNISERKKAEKIISENENHLRQIFNAAQVGITLNVDRKLIFANQYMRKWLGYSVEEIFDKDPFFAYVSREEYEAVGTQLLEGLKKNNFVLQETKFKTKNGKIVNALIHSAYYNEEKKSEGIISVITDITHQKKVENTLRQSEKRFKKLFESNNMPIFLIDDGFIVDCNKAALQLFKYNTKKELLNTHPWNLSPEFQADGSRSDDMSIIQPIIDVSKKRKNTINWIHQDSTGRNFPAEITFSPIVLDNKTYIFEYIRDASIQEKLKESEIQLKKANSDKDKFISVLGHDISSSIGGSISIINLLESKGSDWKEREIFIEHLFENTRVAFDLVKKIITWGKASLGKEMFSPFDFDLFDLFESIKELYKTQLAHKKLELTINCPRNQKVFADMNMLAAIIRNLIKNSIKFTKQGGFIQCDVTSNDHSFEVTISDNGIGMSKKRAENLFLVNNIFSEKGTDGEKGTGLGLQIVKEYIIAHKGNISVESKPGVGSKFTFTIPQIK